MRRRGRGALAGPCAIGLVLAGAQLAEGCGLVISGVDTSDPDDPTPSGGIDGSSDATDEPADAASCDPSPTNPRACGRCGRDCGGGQCVDGMCTPYVIAENIPVPWYLAVDATHVYVTSHVYRDAGTGDVYAVPKDGGPFKVIADLGDSFDVFVNGTTLVTSSLWDNALFGVPIDVAGPPKVLWDGGQTLDIALRDGTIYFTARGQNNHHPIALRPDKGVISFATLATGDEIEGVAVDATHVYWATRNNPGMISRRNRDGTGPIENWQAVQRVRRITVDEEAVYWTGDRGAARRSKSGADVVTLVDGEVGFGTIVVDATHAYITLYDSGRVVRMNKRDGSSRTELSKDLSNPMGLADDGASIYFTERGGNRVWRMTK